MDADDRVVRIVLAVEDGAHLRLVDPLSQFVELAREMRLQLGVFFTEVEVFLDLEARAVERLDLRDFPAEIGEPLIELFRAGRVVPERRILRFSFELGYLVELAGIVKDAP